MKAIKFLQANGKLKNESKTHSKTYKAPKKILQTEDSIRTLEIDKPTVMQLLKNKKITEKDIQEQIDATEDVEEISKLKAEKKSVKKSIIITTDRKGNDHVLIRPEVDHIASNPDTPGQNSQVDYFEEQRLSSNSSTQRHTMKRKNKQNKNPLMELSESEATTEEEEPVVKGGKKNMVLSDSEEEVTLTLTKTTPEAAAPS